MNDNLDGRHRRLRPSAGEARRVSRREFVGSAAALSWLCATGLPACASAAAGATPANVRVSHDQYGGHTEPCLAVNPRNPRNLLAACELPQTVATYVSFDCGRNWRSNGPLPLPVGSPGGGNVPLRSTTPAAASSAGSWCQTADSEAPISGALMTAAVRSPRRCSWAADLHSTDPG
jgi:hypothetical protein